MNIKVTSRWLTYVAFSLPVLAQLAAPGASGVSMGHLHLNSKDPSGQARFWTEVMGAQTAKLGPMDAYKLPGVLVLVRKADPSAGTDGSVINHAGLKVRDLSAMLVKIEAAHLTILTKNDQQVMFLGPDDLKVELTADPKMSDAVANHHIHFYAPDVDAMKKWYAETFSAIPGKRGRFEAADLPGVNLTFAPSPAALPGTKGRVLDHIGFEVKDLEAFCKKLEAGGMKFDLVYRRVPQLGISIAFLTDPWGTYIELTEGLDKL
jgi:catechol 2,3-dioxygenase-like lactoylglutathione lyase family enzyme